MKDGHVFYAAVHEPRDLRRDLLMSQKSILDSLKKYEHVRAIRAEKEMRILELKKMLSALRIVTGQLKSRLPANAIKARVPEMKPAPSAPAKKEAQQRKTKLQVLEDELAKIEAKLSSIE